MKISNWASLFKIVKKYIYDKPKIRKAIGIILILIGLAALLTPFTPGSWLIFIGAESLGTRLLFRDKLIRWWRKINN
ncbi:MAG: hypothetical protein AAB465_00175 [Patescibacteria group bacterium]